MNNIIEEVIQRTNDEIPFEKGSPYTKEGFDALKVEIASYINDLITESYRISNRSKSDLISKSHIENASMNLIKKYSNNNNQILSSIGAFLLGFTITKTAESFLNGVQSLSFTNALILFIAGLLGAFLLGSSLTIFRSNN